MNLVVVKLRDGYLVKMGQDVLIRGLREKTDAFKIRYDILRKGYFRGRVIFAATGKTLEVTVPADVGIAESDRDYNIRMEQRRIEAQEGTVDDL